MNAPRQRWAEDETKLALFLYFQLPFGQLHSGNPEIQKLAGILGRTNSSVAMKLCNFASLDAKITESGRKGLRGASAQDKRLWVEFGQNWTASVEAAEQIWSSPEGNDRNEGLTVKESRLPFIFQPPEGPTTAEAVVQRRIGQGFFRQAVLANFDHKCCITGIAQPALLNASHIVPWGIDVKNRHNPGNGLCLSATFDRAFDCGLVTLDRVQAIVISRSLLAHASRKTRDYFSPFQGIVIASPSRFEPDPAFLEWHRNARFLDAQ